MNPLSEIQKALGVLLVMAALMAGSYYAGYNHVKTKWDTEKSVNDALARSEAIRQEKVKNEREIQYKKDIAVAESAAGKRAVRDYLISIGVLSIGTKLQIRPVVQTVPDATDTNVIEKPASESGTSEKAVEFAIGCGKDAITVLEYQTVTKAYGMWETE